MRVLNQEPYPVGTPFRARQHPTTFLTGQNMFNHSTVGKIVRFGRNDYGFLCLECYANYRGIEAYLRHIEEHFAGADQRNDEEILPIENGNGGDVSDDKPTTNATAANAPSIAYRHQAETLIRVLTSGGSDTEGTNVLDAMDDVAGVQVRYPMNIVIDETVNALEEVTVEEPTLEEPTVEEPTVEEPTVEEPTVGEPTEFWDTTAKIVAEAKTMINDVTNMLREMRNDTPKIPNDIAEIADIIEDMPTFDETLEEPHDEQANVTADDVPEQSHEVIVESVDIENEPEPDQRENPAAKPKKRKYVRRNANPIAAKIARRRQSHPPKRKHAISSLQDIFRCTFCAREFRKLYNLEQHNKTIHWHIVRKLKQRGRLLMCLLCGEEFTKNRYAAADLHMKEHWDDGDFLQKS